MALIHDFDDGYTRTGTSAFSRWSDKVSYIPFVGGFFAWWLGMAGAVVESAQWLFQGKIGSAATALAAGAVSSTINGFVGTTGSVINWWVGNALSGVATGETIGSHGRALTETVIGGVSGVLGLKPEVLKSYQAGIGYIGGGNAPQQAAPQGPGYWATRRSQEQGLDANEAYARYRSGAGNDHVAALESARELGGNAYGRA